ncbi:MAG: Crp/Fnr family transcriptional regulator [Pyrinomonadaceae bacterium]
MTMDKVAVLRQTELFGDLSDEVHQVLANHAIEKQLARNEIVFIGGEEASGLFVIAEGSVRAFRTGQDGREQTIHVERAVTTIAEVPVFDEGRYPSTAAAEEATTLLFLDKHEVRELSLQYPQIALAATKLLARRLRRCAKLVESLSLKEVGQRLAQMLFEEAALRGRRTPDGGLRFKQKLTHNQLAARVGTVREVITRALVRLQQQKLIIVNGKEIIIPDPEVLSGYADSE